MNESNNRAALTTTSAMLLVNIVVGSFIVIRTGVTRKADGLSLSLGALLIGYNYLGTRTSAQEL